MKDEERLQQFVENLVSLGSQLSAIFKSGKVELKDFERMNATVEKMHTLQSDSTVEELVAIDASARVIYANFNAAVVMIRSNEKPFMSPDSMKALNVFLRNMNKGVVEIASAYGLV